MLAGGNIKFRSKNSKNGSQVIDLLDLSENQIRELRGERIAMIFQDPGKALNPGLTIRTQIAEFFRNTGK